MAFAAILALLTTLAPAARAEDKSTIHNISITALLIPDGSAAIEETWDMTIRDGTENYKQLFEMRNERLGYFSVSENGVPYQPLTPWNVDLSRAQKAGRYGINQTEDGPELCWGIGMQNGRHVYKIRYSLRDMVTLHDDDDGSVKAALYWQFISKKFQSAERVELRVVPPGPIGSDHHFWIFGFNGGIDVTSADYRIRAENVRVGHFVELALIMPTGDFPGAKRIDYRKLTAIRKNGRSGDDLNRYTAEAPKDTGGGAELRVFAILVMSFLSVLINFLFRPRLPIKQHAPSSVPPEETLESIAHLLSVLNKTPELLNTFMITWIYKGYIRIEQDITDNSGDSKIYLDSRPERFDGPYERRFFSVVADGLIKDNGTPAKAYGKYLGNFMSESLRNIDNDFARSSHAYCAGRGWLTEVKSSGFSRPFKLRAAVIALLLVGVVFFGSWALIPAALCFLWQTWASLTAKFSTDRLSAEGLKLFDEVLGFASYLCNYSLLEKRGIEHIELWDSYMAFAHLLGIAYTLELELSKINPSYRLDNECSVYIHSSFYHDSLRSHYTPTSSSGGGGGSGSSGGGGGGSGGGGGGGTR